jgi:hypothetical protein
MPQVIMHKMCLNIGILLKIFLFGSLALFGKVEEFLTLNSNFLFGAVARHPAGELAKANTWIQNTELHPFYDKWGHRDAK